MVGELQANAWPAASTALETAGGDASDAGGRGGVPELVVIWAASAIALAPHELPRHGLLRPAGIHPRPSLHFPRLGWRFSPAGATPRQLVEIWLIRPLAESLVWVSVARLFPPRAWELLPVVAVEMGTSLPLPSGDGWLAHRWLRRSRLRAGAAEPLGRVSEVTPGVRPGRPRIACLGAAFPATWLSASRSELDPGQGWRLRGSAPSPRGGPSRVPGSERVTSQMAAGDHQTPPPVGGSGGAQLGSDTNTTGPAARSSRASAAAPR